MKPQLEEAMVRFRTERPQKKKKNEITNPLAFIQENIVQLLEIILHIFQRKKQMKNTETSFKIQIKISTHIEIHKQCRSYAQEKKWITTTNILTARKIWKRGTI